MADIVHVDMSLTGFQGQGQGQGLLKFRKLPKIALF